METLIGTVMTTPRFNEAEGSIAFALQAGERGGWPSVVIGCEAVRGGLSVGEFARVFCERVRAGDRVVVVGRVGCEVFESVGGCRLGVEVVRAVSVGLDVCGVAPVTV